MLICGLTYFDHLLRMRDPILSFGNGSKGPTRIIYWPKWLATLLVFSMCDALEILSIQCSSPGSSRSSKPPL